MPKNEQLYVESVIEDYLTNPQLTLVLVADQFNERFDWNYQRKAISTLRKKLGYPARDKLVESNSRRNSIIKKKTGSKETSLQILIDKILSDYTIEEFQQEYEETSINHLAKKFDVTAYRIKQILDKFGIQEKELPKTVYDLIEELKQKGYDKDKVSSIYLDKTVGINEFCKEINEIITEREVSLRQCKKLLELWNIKKGKELKSYIQGKKSRDELELSLNNLKKAGFSDRQELANYYESNPSLTKQGVTDYINTFLDDEDEPFTLRWVCRHIDPILSPGRMTGVSRGENGLYDFIELILLDSEIERNNRTLIPPYEIDIYIPEHSVALEFNGNYWHSDKFLVKNHGLTAVQYHTMKQTLCKEKGIDLLFVWEFDWDENKEIIQKALMNYFYGSNDKHEILNKLSY